MPNLIKCRGDFVVGFLFSLFAFFIWPLSLDSEAILLMAQWLACAQAASPVMEEDVQHEHVGRDHAQSTGDTEVSTAIL